MEKPNVKHVAYYVINKLNSQIETIKLQKIVYYCQAWSLAWDGVPLFEQDFQAWANGPVCRELYDMHRGTFLVSKRNFQLYSKFNFTPEQIETMDIVINTYGDKTPFWLSNLTHLEDPWKLARIGIPSGDRSTNIISKESMQEYYSGLLNVESKKDS